MASLINIISRQLDRDVYKAHVAWLRAGAKGPGRLVVKDQPLLRLTASATNLAGAKFEGCDLRGANFSNCHLNQSELLDCDISKANLHMATLNKAKVIGTNLSTSRLTLSNLEGTTLIGCNLSEAGLSRMGLVDAKLKNCNLADAVLIDIAIEGSEFLGCDFRGANLSWRLAGSKRLGRASDSVFLRCDFRDADFSGFRVSGCTFIDCLFHGAKGVPELDNVTVKGVDLSAGHDRCRNLPSALEIGTPHVRTNNR